MLIPSRKGTFGLFLAGLLLSPLTLLAQDDRATIEVLAITSGPGGSPGHTVASVAADGSVQLRPMELPPEVRGLFARSEGYYLLLPLSDRRPSGVFRVQVQEVGPGGILNLARSAEAAQFLKVGDPVLLLRPPTASTAQLQALPGAIPLIGGVGETTDPTQMAKRRRSINNLKQIALAMHNFESAMGRFPPAVIFGPDGKPWHSWRVLLLPYLEQLDLYHKYDFGQPWNSEHNLKLLDEMPAVYRDPVHDDPNGHVTHYVAITSKNDGKAPAAAFSSEGPKQTDPKRPPLDQGIGLRDFTDGTSNTILVVPADPARKILWTRPEDLVIETRPDGKRAEFGKADGIPTFYTMNAQKGGVGVAPVAFADGSVHSIAATIHPLVAGALQTRNGGEVISRESIISDTARPTPSVQRLLIQTVNGKTTATLLDAKP